MFDEHRASASLSEAISGGAGAEWGLTERHISRARSVGASPDGSIQFTVERHPHLFERESKGHRSSAFVRQDVTYALFPDGKIGELIRVVLGVDHDPDLLVEEEICLMMECFGSELELQAHSLAEAKAEAQSTAEGLDWFSTHLLGVDDDLRPMAEEILHKCCPLAVTVMAERLVNDWLLDRDL